MIDLLLETSIRNSQRQLESFFESTNGHDLVRYIPWSEHFCEQSRTLVNALAEVDGNRTWRTGCSVVPSHAVKCRLNRADHSGRAVSCRL